MAEFVKKLHGQTNKETEFFLRVDSVSLFIYLFLILIYIISGIFTYKIFLHLILISFITSYIYYRFLFHIIIMIFLCLFLYIFLASYIYYWAGGLEYITSLL